MHELWDSRSSCCSVEGLEHWTRAQSREIWGSNGVVWVARRGPDSDRDPGHEALDLDVDVYTVSRLGRRR